MNENDTDNERLQFSTAIDRREFIGHLAVGAPAGLIWLSSCSSTQAVQNPASREPSNDETGPLGMRPEASSAAAKKHLQTYAKAVKAMRAQPLTLENGKPNGLNWTVQARIHKASCPHGTWAFFPWHREYLFRFERIIAKMGGDNSFKLPYWDWSKNPGLPAMMKTNLELNTMTLFKEDTSRKADIRDAILNIANPQILSGIMASNDFEAFMGSADASGEAEYGPHNGVHIVLGNLGSPMGDFLSPLDPVFWLHHCNVDRIWAVWQEKNGQWRNPEALKQEYAKWMSVPLKGFYDDSGKRITKSRKAEDVIDTISRGYNYAELKVRTASVWQKGAARVPAGEGWKYEMRAFTRDDIPAQLSWSPKKDRMDVVFPGFRSGGNVDRLLDECVANPADFAEWVFRLRVLNFPKVDPKALMRIKFKFPAIGGKPAALTEVTQYSFFIPQNQIEAGAAPMIDAEDGDAVDHAAHGHAEHAASPFIPTFNFDFKKLLARLNEMGFRKYPDPTEFRFEFVNGYTRAPVSFGAYDFKQLQFKVSILERIAR